MIDDHPNRARAVAHRPVDRQPQHAAYPSNAWQPPQRQPAPWQTPQPQPAPWQTPQPHPAAYPPTAWQPPQSQPTAYHANAWQPPQPPPGAWQSIQPRSGHYPVATTPAPSVQKPAHRGHQARPKRHVDTILATVLAVLVAAAGLVTSISATSADGHLSSVPAVHWAVSGIEVLFRPNGTAAGEVVAAGIDTPTTNL